MEWQDQGIVLAVRPHSESGLIVSLMTREHGRHAGLARAGRNRAHLQPGSRVQATWKARLAEHLGLYRLEAEFVPAGALLDDPDRLTALAAACALVEETVAEREPMPELFDGLEVLTRLLPETIWPAAYVRWEIGLLSLLGFALDLSKCASTGRTDDLIYVSPRTGRAVGRDAGAPYADKLLPLPGFLTGADDDLGRGAVAQGLKLTGFFLERFLLGQGHKPLPAARKRLRDRYPLESESGDESESDRDEQ